MSDLKQAAEKAIEALESMCRHFSISRLGESSLDDSNERVAAHGAAAALRAALAAEPSREPVDIAAMCAQIGQTLGENWLVIGPDGSRFSGPSPHRAANAANKHFGAMQRAKNPQAAAEFVALLAETRRKAEERDAELMALYGSLNCPTCGGSGHVGDAAPAAPVMPGWKWVPVEMTERMEIAAALAHEQSKCHDHIGPITDAWSAALTAAPTPSQTATPAPAAVPDGFISYGAAAWLTMASPDGIIGTSLVKTATEDADIPVYLGTPAPAAVPSQEPQR